MVDGSDQAAAFRTAFDQGLPALIGAARAGVERGVQGSAPATFALRCSLLAYLRVAEWTAELVLEVERIGGRPPARPAPSQIHAPLGVHGPVVEEPLVPRRTGHDPRLPGGRYHP